MCGIAGFYNPNQTGNFHIVADSMLESIKHRGFDNRGVELYSMSNGSRVCFGHNRLSIIGLSNLSHQPLSYMNFHISYNGEIYNYIELRNELIEYGYKFNSQSDTEVILKLIDRFGLEGVTKLNGMFAIALLDSESERIYLIRDRLGVKPLFYHQNENILVFGSEVQSVLKYPDVQKEYDSDIIGNYLTNGYINSFNSIFSGIKKIENGTILTYELKTGSCTSRKYWSLENNSTSVINDYKEAYNEFDKVLESSIKYRLVADVPVGLFLSSGLDSNLILNTFLKLTQNDIVTYSLNSLDFNEPNVKSDNSRVKRNYLSLQSDQKWTIYKTLCKNFGEPLADPATIGLFKLSEEAAKSLKVIMVGDGGDELLGGYNSYKLCLKYGDRYSLFKFLYKIISPITSAYMRNHIEKPALSKLALLHSILSGENMIDIVEKRKLLQQDFVNNLTKFEYKIMSDNNNSDTITNFLNYKTESELIHQLNYKTDIAGMLNTVEIREPLLDYRLFDLQQRISNDLFRKMMMADKSKKIILDIMKMKYNIDTANMTKMGFHLDYQNMLSGNDELEDIINSYQSGYLEKKAIIKLWESYKKHKVEPSLMYRIITFIMWDYYQN